MGQGQTRPIGVLALCDIRGSSRRTTNSRWHRPPELLSVNASFHTALTIADKMMAARQTASLQQPNRALHDEGLPSTERYIEALQKLQRTLQIPGSEPRLTGEVLARDVLPTLVPVW